MPSRNYNIKHITCGVMPFVINFTFYMYKHRFSCDPLIRVCLQRGIKQKVVNVCLAHDCNKIYTVLCTLFIVDSTENFFNILNSGKGQNFSQKARHFS
jgi:hypothetical protein